mmetsp:Transcript_77366/g.215043  ORF Transcript_77366/g.215043 Transcript_77366/m.215043 type:complete len:452 (-) Transcript_77366:260-1615(-)
MKIDWSSLGLPCFVYRAEVSSFWNAILLDFRVGCGYFGRCLAHAALWAGAGVIFGSVPAGLLMNFCSSRFVEACTWDASLLAASWSNDDILHMDTSSALVWIVWSGLTYSVSIVPGICLAYAWRGGETFSTRCSAFFIVCTWGTTFVCAILPGVLVLTRAISVHKSPLILQVLTTYALCLLSICTLLPTHLMMIRPLGTSVRQLGYIPLTYLHIFVSVCGAIQLVLFYWTTHSAQLRLAVIMALIALRAYSEAVALRLALCWPGADLKQVQDVALVVSSYLGSIIQTPCYFLQAGTDNPWVSLGANLLLAFAELGRNILHLRGTTPLECLVDYTLRLCNDCRNRNKKVFSEVVPGSNPSRRPPISLPMLYPKMVAVQNYSEIVVLFLVYSLKLVGKLSPDKVGDEPQSVSFVTTRLVYAVGLEAMTDVATAVCARRQGDTAHLELTGISRR